MDIDSALVGVGVQGRLTQVQVANKYGLGRGQISRHVNNGHIAAIMQGVQEEVTRLHGTGLLVELGALYERANRLVAKAEHADDLRVAVAAVREMRGVIETFARIGMALSQGEDKGGDDRPDLDSKIEDALRKRETRLALAEATSTGPPSDPDDEIAEAEVVDP